jgi:formate hydrogenlyase transcriptional activator
LLAAYFAQKHSLRMNKKIDSIPRSTVDALSAYRWPGNVREMENFIECAVILTHGPELQAPLNELKGSPGVSAVSSAAGNGPKAKSDSLEDVERAHIEEILRQTGGMIAGKGGAAEILGLPSSTLRSRMKKLGIK